MGCHWNMSAVNFENRKINIHPAMCVFNLPCDIHVAYKLCVARRLQVVQFAFPVLSRYISKPDQSLFCFLLMKKKEFNIQARGTRLNSRVTELPYVVLDPALPLMPLVDGYRTP